MRYWKARAIKPNRLAVFRNSRGVRPPITDGRKLIVSRRPQAGLSHLPCAGTELAHQTQATNKARVSGGADSTYGSESGLVNGFYERPADGWS